MKIYEQAQMLKISLLKKRAKTPNQQETLKQSNQQPTQPKHQKNPMACWNLQEYVCIFAWPFISFSASNILFVIKCTHKLKRSNKRAMLYNKHCSLPHWQWGQTHWQQQNATETKTGRWEAVIWGYDKYMN